ncbi:MAG: hypothetical protein HN729_01050 [Candidatus Marinimicrobia bacterium]|jgi:hypothetical protein|nr:hypothetical protein [Candidatus Neomarinimicrobiota bacterium]MBT3633338.1 hypothetical protein [Candidatus Neomarinimicrobiota bacterium]MBT3681481.1 hypothetical protein [Candidatus Neomarinimicrobiota bacterium]MBT3758552.1 hypothetical protein [Candidatus Neomarinimicrobiota bacterium]MBT3894794.1 hypothetical protein [Candidatus Neomarinimicrobiota bacterium]
MILGICKKLIVLFIFLLFNPLISQQYSDQLQLRTDQLGQSSYYFRSDNPFIFDDAQVDNINFNGSLNNPTSRFLFSKIPDIKPDSTVLTFFKWHQGDFSYREILVGLSSINLNGTLINFKGMGRSFPGKYNHLNTIGSSSDNVLQNYLITFGKESDRSTSSISFFHHRENSGIPVNATNNSYRKSRSYNAGVSYRLSGDMVTYDFSGAFQFLHTSTQTITDIDENTNISYEDFTYWLDSKAIYNLSDNSEYIVKYSIKKVNISPQNLSQESQDLFDYQGYLNYRWQDGIETKIGVIYLSNEKIYPVGSAFKKYDKLTFGISRNVFSSFYHESDFILEKKYWHSSSVWSDFNHGKFSSKLKIIQLRYENENYLIINPQISYLVNWFELVYSGHYNNSETSIISEQSSFSIEIIPTLKNKRYRPFIKLEGTHTNLNGSGNNNINFLETNQLSYYPDSKIYSLLDMSIGIKIEHFSVSFKFVQIFDKNSIVSPEILPVDKMNFLDVFWLFND